MSDYTTASPVEICSSLSMEMPDMTIRSLWLPEPSLGSSIELSADAPIKKPYIAYMRG